MKAAYIETTGGPELIRVGELPTPEPRGKEVRVRIAAAALNPIDLYLRSGTVAANLPKPFISGCDLAGVVDAVGPEATRFRNGERVWGSNQGLLGRQGTSAEFACVHEQWLYPTPDNVSDIQAAAVALTGITAHLGLFQYARLRPGETIFVNGGTGGVGSMVVQLAKAHQAKVIATVGNAEKAKQCAAWGADNVIQYKTEDVPARIKQATEQSGLQVWFETQREQDFTRIIESLSPRGRIVVIAGRQSRPILPVGPFYTKGLSLFGFAMFNATPEEQETAAADLNRCMSTGKLVAAVGKVFPLREAAAAHRLLEDNAIHSAGTLSGKVVITMGD